MAQNNFQSPGRWVWLVLGLGVIVLLMAAAAFFVVRAGWMGVPATQAGPEKGMPAPDFSGRTLTGETVRLSDYRGKPVVLNFFAGWCSPCKKEAPHLQDAHERAGDGAVFLGVTFQDSQASAQLFVDEHGLTFPVVLDESEDIGKTYRIRSFPVTVFVRPDGVIHTVIKGPVTREFVAVMLEGMPDL